MCVGLFLVQLDVTIVNVALPTIGAGLGTSVSGLQWVVDGYAVPFASLLLAGGTLGDRYGHRHLVLWGLAFFGVGSAACGLAPTDGVLIAARAVQGVGAAALLPATLAVITHAYPEKKERAKAIGIWAAIAGLSLPLGPLLGGLLVAGPGWRWVFLINLPIIAAALVPVLKAIPPSREATAGRLDIPGTVLGALVLTGCTLTLIEGGHSGWLTSATAVACLATLVLACAFLFTERRHPEPAVPLSLFRTRSFSTANGAALVMNLVGIGTIFITTLYLQDVLHLAPLLAGAGLLPMFVPLIGLAPLTGRITARCGPRLPATTGLLLGATGMALLATVEADTSYPGLLATLLLLGIALGLLTTPLVATAVSTAPHERAGLAGAVNNTARQTGGALGIALFGSLAGPPSHTGAFITGLHHIAATAAALYLLTAAATARWLPARTGRPSGSA
ncbi:MFS transporter OS=Streptomyces tendae OX=1932 GN=F3L20_25895 PE=4 SV=1 [Streptomyces tendae]